MPYKKKKLESCFDSLEKIVSLRDTLTGAVSNVSTNLEWAVERLEMGRRFDEAKIFYEKAFAKKWHFRKI